MKTETDPRWEGTAPEPRAGLSSGHIPNSLPAPFAAYLRPVSDKEPYTSYRSPEELREVFAAAVGGKQKWDEVVKGERNLVFTCGSGMTAAIGWLANELLRETEGVKAKTSLYDEVGYSSPICRIDDRVERARLTTELVRLCCPP